MRKKTLIFLCHLVEAAGGEPGVWVPFREVANANGMGDEHFAPLIAELKGMGLVEQPNTGNLRILQTGINEADRRAKAGEVTAQDLGR